MLHYVLRSRERRRRYALGAQPANLEEVRQGLGRIVKDANRAGEVISRIRELIIEALVAQLHRLVGRDVVPLDPR